MLDIHTTTVAPGASGAKLEAVNGGKRTRLNQMISEQTGTPVEQTPGRSTRREAEEGAVETDAELADTENVGEVASSQLAAETAPVQRQGLYANPIPFARFAHAEHEPGDPSDT